MNYDNLFLPADDFAASQRFYGETLGLSVKFTFPELGMTAYRVGDEEAAIILKDRQRYPDTQPAIWITVENVAETYAALRERVAFRSDPSASAPAGRSNLPTPPATCSASPTTATNRPVRHRQTALALRRRRPPSAGSTRRNRPGVQEILLANAPADAV